MGALAQADGRRCRRILEPPQPVDPRPRRVDDGPGADARGLAAEEVTHLRSRDAPALIPELRHLRVVEDGGARIGCGADVGEAQAAVVCPRVGVEPAAAQAFEPKRRDAAQRSLRRNEAAEALARESGVEPEPGLDRERAVGAALVDREEERQAPDEVRGDDAHEGAPLLVCLADEPHVAETQVAEAAVDELRGRARRRGAEVALVDERDREPRARRLVGDAGSDDPGADDQQVELAARELLERLSAPL